MDTNEKFSSENKKYHNVYIYYEDGSFRFLEYCTYFFVSNRYIFSCYSPDNPDMLIVRVIVMLNNVRVIEVVPIDKSDEKAD